MDNKLAIDGDGYGYGGSRNGDGWGNGANGTNSGNGSGGSQEDYYAPSEEIYDPAVNVAFGNPSNG